MARAIWKGSVNFGLVNIPISLYPADANAALDFHMLDKKDLSPISFKRVSKKTGKEVPYDRIVKGFEVDEGRYVVLEPADFKNANVKASQTIEIQEFVDLNEISPVFFERAYYLEPLKSGRKAYALLRETLRRSKKVGIATVVIHTREYVAAVLPQDNALIVELLRFADEVRPEKEFDLPSAGERGQAPSAKELSMAEMLVKAMAGRFEPSKYKNTYRDDLLRLIKQKAKTGKVTARNLPVGDEGERSTDVFDLMPLLKASLGGKSTAKAARGGAVDEDAGEGPRLEKRERGEKGGKEAFTKKAAGKSAEKPARRGTPRTKPARVSARAPASRRPKRPA